MGMPTQDSGQIEPAPGLFRALGEGSVVAGRYEIERLVARGGMATVFLARQLGLGRQVALKLVHPAEEDVEDRGAFQDRFRLEAKTLASLSHPHIVTVHDYGETEDGDCFIAMEYVEGPRFARLLKEGPLPTQRAVDLVIQVCRALRYAHSKGVIHRDVKLSNVLIGQDEHGEEHVKVVDFGLVKITGNEQKLTSHGLVLGSPHFMAPEQVRGGAIDHRADLYSVGILLYCSLTGRYPFHGASRTATMTAHLSREVPAFSDLVPERRFPPGLEAVVLQALEKDIHDRQPDMDAFITQLMPFASGPSDLPSMGVTGPATLVQHPPGPTLGRAARPGPTPSRLLAVAAATFVVSLALVFGIWQAWAPPRGPVVAMESELPRALPAPPPALATEVSVEEPEPEQAVPSPAPSSAPEPEPARRSTRRAPASSTAPRRQAPPPQPQPSPAAGSSDPDPAAAEPAGPAPDPESTVDAEPRAKPPPSDLADPWEGDATGSDAETADDATPSSWEQAGGDLRDPWGD